MSNNNNGHDALGNFQQLDFSSSFREFIYDEDYFDIASLNREESDICSDFVRQLDDKTRRRLSNPGGGITMNGLGFPLPHKLAYTYQNSDAYRDFMTDVYNLTVDFGSPEPRLLVASHLIPPYCMEFLPDPNLITDQLAQVSRVVLDNFFAALLSFEPHIRIRAKKMSTPGFPWRDVNGGDITAAKAVINFRGASLIHGYSKKDYSKYKKGLKNQILEAEDYFLRGDFNVTPDNVSDLLLNGKIPLICSGYRTNNIPTPDIKGTVTRGQKIISKDRACSLPYGKYRAMSFRISNEKLYDLQLSKTGQWFGLSRKRVINIENFVPSVCRHAFAQSIISGLENSKYGFLSVSDPVVARYMNFLRVSRANGHTLLFFTGDRSNNDAFLTANISKVISLFPKELNDYATKTFKAVRVTRSQTISITGMLSGIPETTLANVFGSLLLFYPIFFKKLLGVAEDDFVIAYTKMLENKDDYFTLEGVHFFLPLPTDNIPFVASAPKVLIDKLTKAIDRLSSWLDSQDVSFEYSNSQMQEFGCLVDQHGIQISPSSILSKLFFFETAGFYERDCYKIATRLNMLDRSFYKSLMKIFSRHFGSSLTMYDRIGDEFIKILERSNIELREFVNQYNPTEAQIYSKIEKTYDIGEGVPPSFLLDSSLLDTSFYQSSLDSFSDIRRKILTRTKEEKHVNTQV